MEGMFLEISGRLGTIVFTNGIHLTAAEMSSRDLKERHGSLITIPCHDWTNIFGFVCQALSLVGCCSQQAQMSLLSAFLKELELCVVVDENGVDCTLPACLGWWPQALFICKLLQHQIDVMHARLRVTNECHA